MEARRDVRRVADHSGDIYIPKISTAEPLRLECTYFLELVDGQARPRKVARDGARVVRALEMLTNSLDMAEIHPTAIVYPGTVLGEGVRVLENAVVGKQPSLGARSTAKREPLPPTTIGDGTIVSTGAIVFAGSTIGARLHRRRPVVHPRARARSATTASSAAAR